MTAPLSVAAVQMGTRTYVPALASFLQPDPVPGGAATPYAYVPDPINATDSSGALPEWASTVIKVAVTLLNIAVVLYISRDLKRSQDKPVTQGLHSKPDEITHPPQVQ